MVRELEDGLRVIVDDAQEDSDPAPAESAAGYDGELESVRNEFVDAFNARDLDAVLALVADDVECPDRRASGAAELSQELVAIWERSPAAILTNALLDGEPCAVAWLPDEDGCWSRAAIVCLDAEDGLVGLFEIPDDANALERAEADDPTGEDLDQGLAWSEYDTGEVPASGPRR